MQYLFFLLQVAIAYTSKLYLGLKRAVCFRLWKRNRDRLTLEQFLQSLELEYYEAFIEDLYRGEK